MLGFEPRISGVGSDRSTNWATTTAHGVLSLDKQILSIIRERPYWRKKNLRGQLLSYCSSKCYKVKHRSKISYSGLCFRLSSLKKLVLKFFTCNYIWKKIYRMVSTFSSTAFRRRLCCRHRRESAARREGGAPERDHQVFAATSRVNGNEAAAQEDRHCGWRDPVVGHVTWATWGIQAEAQWQCLV